MDHVSEVEVMMDIDDLNSFQAIAGGFVGLGDDDDAVSRFRNSDTNNEQVLREVIEELIVPDYLSCDQRERSAGMEVLKTLAQMSREEQESQWDSDLPPFDYPADINLYQLMYEVLQGKSNQ
jgi:hypothetical protein